MRNELISLRKAMAEAKVDAYIIPTDDFHGSEYVGEYFRGRAYVSGFTGSAGTLVVTGDWAGLWTDGRYFLQGAQQLQGSGIDLMKMNEPGVPTIQKWLEENTREGDVVGFDGRCMTIGTGKNYAKAVKKAGGSVRHDLDLVGEIWEDRPPLSDAPVWELGQQYAGRSRRDKLETLRKDVQELGADVHILTSLDDIAWLLNIRGADVACCPVVLADILLVKDKCYLYTDEKKYSPELIAALNADGVELRPYLDLYEDVKHLPEDSRVLLDPGTVNYSLLNNLPEKAKVIRKQNPSTLPKAIKTEAEYEGEKLAHIKDGVALTRFMKWLHEHVGKEEITEISAAEKLESFREEMEHYLCPSFEPIMGFAEHGAIVHYSATEESNAALEPRSFLLADTGGHYLEGSTDVTRTFVLGPLTDAMKHHYTLVLKGHLALGGAIFKEGCTGQALDVLARKPFWDEGLDYNHGTGHGVGHLLSVHEGPQNIRYHSQTSAATANMAAGMITSDEPGIYLEGQYGVRLENLTLCVEKMKNEYGTFLGFEMLTMCPFELEAINVEELTAEEKKLLNQYHADVYEKLAPYFTDEEKQWLREATRAV